MNVFLCNSRSLITSGEFIYLFFVLINLHHKISSSLHLAVFATTTTTPITTTTIKLNKLN